MVVPGRYETYHGNRHDLNAPYFLAFIKAAQSSMLHSWRLFDKTKL